MRKIFTLYLLLLSAACFSQVSDRIMLSIYKQVKETPPSSFVLCRMGASLIEQINQPSVPKVDIIKALKEHYNCCGPRPKQDTMVVRKPVILSCRRVIIDSSCQPLLVINGKPGKLDTLSSINPNDIESIEIFKGAQATALFGSHGVNGVIWMNTKSASPKTFIIKENGTANPIPGATLVFTSTKDKNEKFHFVADDSGMIVTDKLRLDAKYEMEVSSVGHTKFKKQFYSHYSSLYYISLNKEIKTCDEVFVSAIVCYRKMICRTGCWSYRNVDLGKIEKETEQDDVKIKVYPNPVQKGASLNLQFDNIDEEEKMVRVFTIDGKLVMQRSLPAVKENSTQSIQLSTQFSWTAGIYFIQLLYENGEVLASEKIIIQ